MTEKTRGLVLSFIKYKETSIICKIFTESFGVQSYIINGIRNSKSKNIGFFQPLNILDLVVYHKKSSDLHRIKETKFQYVYRTIHLDIKKISMCFFLSEFLSKVLSNEENQNQKFEFILNSLIFLDSLSKDYSNFHIQFLIKFSRLCGFEITKSNQLTDLGTAENDVTKYVDSCIKNNYDIKINSNNILRNKVINLLLKYFSKNLDITISLKSANVLKEIFK
ncbi:MAG: DNA repair protein RecO [Bacteroidota bacterium]|nr:DNA repair protein RecO [Bacteroidota bacterium]